MLCPRYSTIVQSGQAHAFGLGKDCINLVRTPGFFPFISTTDLPCVLKQEGHFHFWCNDFKCTTCAIQIWCKMKGQLG